MPLTIPVTGQDSKPHVWYSRGAGRGQFPPPAGTRCTGFSTQGPRGTLQRTEISYYSVMPWQKILHNHLENSILTELME